MNGIPTKQYSDGTQGAGSGLNALKLTPGLRKGLYAWYHGDHQPSLSAPNGYGDPTGVTGNIDRMVCGGSTFPLRSQYHVKGTQTLLGPLLDVDKGLEVSQDQTDDDGIEHVFGCLGLGSAFVYTVGSQNAFLRMKFRIEDVSGTDHCLVGFRKNEAFTADWNDYTQLAAVNMVSGDVKSSTILDNAATVNTDSGDNWADDATHEFLVKLIGTRVAFFLDGSPLPQVPIFNFNAAEVVVPFFYFLQDADITKVWWKEVEVGLLSDINTKGVDQP